MGQSMTLRTNESVAVPTDNPRCSDSDVLLLNLMPTRERTRKQFDRLVRQASGSSVVQLHLESHEYSCGIPESSVPWSHVDTDNAKALIVTGAPLEHLAFSAVDYWREFNDIIHWAQESIPQRMFICWGAQAALYVKYGILPKRYSTKLSGLIRQRVALQTDLLRDIGDGFVTPVSRHTGVDEADVERIPELEVLATGDKGDLCLAATRSGRDVFMMNHLEYDPGSLADEYFRDVETGCAPSIPENYFPQDDVKAAPLHLWKDAANTLFSNWLNQELFPLPSSIENREPCSTLLTPGPLALATKTKQAMLLDFGSRSHRIKTVTRRVRQSVLQLANGADTHSVVPIQGSGSFAVEAAFRTFLSASSRPLVIVNGIYGRRMVSMLKRQGVEPLVIQLPVDECINLDRIESILQHDATITHLIFVHCETTTGIWNPYKALLRIAREHGVLSVVDSMSAFGCLPVDAANDGFDVLVTSGNKCLEAPPGIAFVLAKRSLLTAERDSLCDSYCFDLIDQWNCFEMTGQWRTTPPVHVLQALDSALKDLKRETVEGRKACVRNLYLRLVEGARGFLVRNLFELP